MATTKRYYKSQDLRRHVHVSHLPGEDVDHVVELQIVKKALNDLVDRNFRYRNDDIKELIHFFNAAPNLQYLDVDVNEKKGEAVGKYLRGGQLEPYEVSYIRMIKTKWQQDLRSKLNAEGFTDFVSEMNRILHN